MDDIERLATIEQASISLIQWVAQHLWLDTAVWADYGHRDETRREHLQTLLAYLGLMPFGLSEFRTLVNELTKRALQTDKGLVLALHALQSLRQRQVVVPAWTSTNWTGFTRHFVHVKSEAPTKHQAFLLSAILADGINLGLIKMAASCPGITYGRLSWLQAWHIHDETYTAALAELTNTQLGHAFAGYWGDGTTSSSDGQRFRAGGRGESTGHVNPRYGGEPGRLFYTHISDQYAPFHTQVVNVGIRDSTYVLDGLLYHESDPRIEEHYTDTAGFTDHVFALMHLLGFRFAPRIRNLKDTRLYVPLKRSEYPELQAMIGGTLNVRHIRAHWDEILRLATSIQQGTVTASLMVRKLGSYPRQNSLAVALRELGRIERTLFILDWLQNVELRRRVHAGLNRGEALCFFITSSRRRVGALSIDWARSGIAVSSSNGTAPVD